jgi:hypothetical protein
VIEVIICSVIVTALISYILFTKYEKDTLDAIKPPNHFNCKSVTIPITSLEVYDSAGELLGITTETAIGQRASTYMPIESKILEKEIEEAVNIIWKYGDIL